jgi:hypothetical protein
MQTLDCVKGLSRTERHRKEEDMYIQNKRITEAMGKKFEKQTKPQNWENRLTNILADSL